jgi:hypothetical protein
VAQAENAATQKQYRAWFSVRLKNVALARGPEAMILARAWRRESSVEEEREAAKSISLSKRPLGLRLMGEYADVVEGGVRYLQVLNLRGPVQHFPEGLHHFWVSSSAIGVRVLLCIPETDSHRIPVAWDNKRDFVLEALLLPKQGNDLLLTCLGELRSAIRFQMHGNVSSNHENLLDGNGFR